MKKIFLFILLLISICSLPVKSQDANIRIGGAKVWWISDSLYMRMSHLTLFPFGLKTWGTSTMNGTLTFGSTFGILTNGGNINLTNGGAYLLDGTSLKLIFGETNDSNYWKRLNKFDTLGIGTAKLTWTGSLINISESVTLPTLNATDIYGSRTIDFRGATSFKADSLKTKRISGQGDSITIYSNGGDYIALDGNSVKVYGNNFVALYGGGQMKLQTDDDSVKVKTDYIGGLTGNYVKEMRVNRLDADTVRGVIIDSASSFDGASSSLYATRNWVMNNFTGGISIDTNNLLGAWRENNRAQIDTLYGYDDTENDDYYIVPGADNTVLGSSSSYFARIYALVFMENGTPLSSKYKAISDSTSYTSYTTHAFLNTALTGYLTATQTHNGFLHSADSLKYLFRSDTTSLIPTKVFVANNYQPIGNYFSTSNLDTTLSSKLAKQNTFINVNLFSNKVGIGTTTTGTASKLSIGTTIGGVSFAIVNTLKNQNISDSIQVQDTSFIGAGITATGKPWYRAVGPTGTNYLYQDTIGAITTGAGVTTGGSLTIPNASFFQWSARGSLGASADGTFSLSNNAGTGFTEFKVGGSTLKAGFIKGTTLTTTSGWYTQSADGTIWYSYVDNAGVIHTANAIF